MQDDDDTPEAIIEAMNADLLARVPGNGRRVIWIHGRPWPDPGDEPAAADTQS